MGVRLFVTGFGAFLNHGENPSAVLAERSGRPHAVLEVSYTGVDDFLEELDGGEFDAWLQIGLAAKAETMLMENVGRNKIGPIPDARDEEHGPGPIDAAGPSAVGATLWQGVAVESEEVKASVDAGGYLCNYLLYRGLRQFPEKRIGFLHVPPFSVMPLERQVEALSRIIEEIG
ncbi:MAG TPA: hypothetical protein VNI20_12850 [Fimbriimonadaceae bacterium]|nr:hypothetical protein [Fimbriimonadaceae bacterium]